MDKKIRVGIVGYGNLGKGVEAALAQNNDMKLVGVFSRRSPSEVVTANPQTQVYPLDELLGMKDHIDTLVLCGGSPTDLPTMTPQLARDFCVVDSFDTHAKIPDHFAAVDAAAREGRTLALISAGWDPGLFSLSRAMGQAVLPVGADYTFWGRGVSQGHSDAVRHIEGVVDARQYTIPVEAALEAVRLGKFPELSTREKHTRLVYVAAEDGANRERIEREIVSMPYYFDAYDTTVIFASIQELAEKHAGLPHGGSALRSGKTGLAGEHTHIIEYRLQLDSNPEFTASILVAYARAAYRLSKEGQIGCRTVFDIAPSYLVNMSPEDMRARLL